MHRQIRHSFLRFDNKDSKHVKEFVPIQKVVVVKDLLFHHVEIPSIPIICLLTFTDLKSDVAEWIGIGIL